MLNYNRFGISRKRRRRGAFGILLPIGFFAAVVYLFNIGVGHLTQANEEEALEAARVAVTRAAVQFYALEGRYPPSLDYLVDRFGIQLDEERFIFHYDAFASNIMPQITVLPR